MPAVSNIVTGIPSKFSLASIVSLVVPASEETIALSSFNKILIRLDLPTFGGPINTILIPDLSLSPAVPFKMSVSILFNNKDMSLEKLKLSRS